MTIQFGGVGSWAFTACDHSIQVTVRAGFTVICICNVNGRQQNAMTWIHSLIFEGYVVLSVFFR